MNDVRFGVFTFQVVPFLELVDDVRFAEQLGMDAVWVADQAVPAGLPILEAWTLLAGLAARSERIRLGTNVTNVAMRNPMILARQVLTVDQIAAGRLNVGLGAGYYEGEHTMIGVDFLDGPGRVRRLRETAEILDKALRGENVTYEGRIYKMQDAISTPPPAQSPRAPLWMAGHATGSMRVAARLGYGAATFGDAGLTTAETLPIFRERMARLDGICAEEGRDPKTLRRSYLAGFAKEDIFSSRESMADFIGSFAEAGATDFIFALYNPASPAMEAIWRTGQAGDRDAFTTLMTEVVPGL